MKKNIVFPMVVLLALLFAGNNATFAQNQCDDCSQQFATRQLVTTIPGYVGCTVRITYRAYNCGAGQPRQIKILKVAFISGTGGACTGLYSILQTSNGPAIRNVFDLAYGLAVTDDFIIQKNLPNTVDMEYECPTTKVYIRYIPESCVSFVTYNEGGVVTVIPVACSLTACCKETTEICLNTGTGLIEMSSTWQVLVGNNEDCTMEEWPAVPDGITATYQTDCIPWCIAQE